MSYTPLIINNVELKLCLKLKEINLLLTKFELVSLVQLEKFLSEQVTGLNLANICEILKICVSRNHIDFNLDLEELELSDIINITNALANELNRSLTGGVPSKEKEGAVSSGKSKK